MTSLPLVNCHRFWKRLLPIVLLAIVLTALVTRVTRANAPAGQYTVSTATVVDNKTRLTWYRTVGTNKNLVDATTFCGALGASWRLPTIKELQTLIDHSQPMPPRLDSNAFAGAPSTGFYLSSTTFATDPNSNWYVNFYSGNTGNQPAAAPSNVLCVRSGT